MLKSSVFDITQAVLRQTKAGSVPQFFDPPTAMLEQVECHMTIVDPRLPFHTPHEHRDEELMIVKEGETIALLNGAESKVGTGSRLFWNG